jgi:hypothetical protein
MKVNIYVPDDLGERMRAKGDEINVSALCQHAISDELDRLEQRAKLAEGMERVQLWDPVREREVAFTGMLLAYEEHGNRITTVYLTAKGQFVVSSDVGKGFFGIFPSFKRAEREISGDLAVHARQALGEDVVVELDI